MADLDTSEELEDPFNRLLPLPYKLSVVLVLGKHYISYSFNVSCLGTRLSILCTDLTSITRHLVVGIEYQCLTSVSDRHF